VPEQRSNARTATWRRWAGLTEPHARSRRAGPLHRWLVDDAAAAELPARSSLPARRDASRSSAVLLQGWAHDMDMLGLRRGGVRAAADRRLPGSRRSRRGALSARSG
jgi:hypothetical protein